MLTVWPGTPSVRTCCASLAMVTSTSRRATFPYTSRRCKALWLATMAQRSSASMSIPCLLWRCPRYVHSLSWSGGSNVLHHMAIMWKCGQNIVLLVVLMVSLLLCPVSAHVPVPREEDVQGGLSDCLSRGDRQ